MDVKTLLVLVIGVLSNPTECGTCDTKGSVVSLYKGIELLIYEGITCNEKNIFMSGAQLLVSVTPAQVMNWPNASVELLTNYDPLPAELKLAGYNHIGDLDYYDGLIYTAIESVNFTNPLIAVYGPNDLKLRNFSPNFYQKHMPWVAVSTASGAPLLLTSEFANVTTLNTFDLTTLKYNGPIKLDHQLQSLQGGVVINGALYLSANPPHPVLARVELNKTRGKVGSVTFPTTAAISAPEAEGVAYCPSWNLPDAPGDHLIVMSGKAYNVYLDCKLFTYSGCV